MPAALLSLLSLVKLFPVGWVVPAVAIIAPFVTYGIGAVKTKYEVRAEERAACTLRISEAQKRADEAAARAFEEARRAADTLVPTPTNPDELVRLCQRDRWCRDRVKAQ